MSSLFFLPLAKTTFAHMALDQQGGLIQASVMPGHNENRLPQMDIVSIGTPKRTMKSLSPTSNFFYD